MTQAILLKKAKTLNEVWNEEHPRRQKFIAGCLFVLSLGLVLWQARSALLYAGKALKNMTR